MMVMVKRQEEPGKRQATLSAYFFCWWNFFTPNAIAPCSGLTTRTRIVNPRKTIFSVIRDL